MRQLFPSTFAYLTSWKRFAVAVVVGALLVFLIPMFLGIPMPVAP